MTDGALLPFLGSVLTPPEQERLIAAAAVVAAYAGATWAILASHRRRRRCGAEPVAAGDRAVLVAFASQTGFAEDLARRTVAALRGLGASARLMPLGDVDAGVLAASPTALFVVSTTGEGDAPDSAARFCRRVLGGDTVLSHLRYGVLALGDSSYARFCAFGRSLDGWLRHRQAHPMFDAVEVDDGDPAALRHWQHNLAAVAGELGVAGPSAVADWIPAAYDRWRLVERRHLNPGSPGGPAFHLAFEPLGGGADWQAGDIAEIEPRNAPADVARALDALGLDDAVTAPGGERLAALLARTRLPETPDDLAPLRALSAAALAARLAPLPHREYSIASLPADGRLELLVRQATGPDGRLGLGSGWLTAHVPVGGEVALRVRRNSGFHAPPGDRPMILIGAVPGWRACGRTSRRAPRRDRPGTGFSSASGRPPRTSSTATRSRPGRGRAFCRAATSCFRGTAESTATSRIASAPPSPSCAPGWRRGLASMSAAACTAWRWASMRRCPRSWAPTGWRRWPRKAATAGTSTEEYG